MLSIGDRIRARRKELRLSVDELADKLGKNRATVYRYENNYIENLPMNILEPLAHALDTTPAYLMGWNKEDSAKENKPEPPIPIWDDEDIRLIARKNLQNISPEEFARKRKKIRQLIQFMFDDDEDDNEQHTN